MMSAPPGPTIPPQSHMMGPPPVHHGPPIPPGPGLIDALKHNFAGHMPVHIKTPVTVLSGFLGAGKTTILKQILLNRKGLKVAVIVNDMAAVNIDAKEVINEVDLETNEVNNKKKQKTQKGNSSELDDSTVSSKTSTAATVTSANPNVVNLTDTFNQDLDLSDIKTTSVKDESDSTKPEIIALQNGCNCCSLKDDLIEQVAELAQARDPKDVTKARFDYIVIENSGISEPIPIARTFVSKHSALHSLCRLDTMVTVADASLMLATICSDTTLKDSHMKHQLHKDHDHEEGEECDEEEDDEVDINRPLSDLLVTQLESADVVVLTKKDLVTKNCKDKDSELSIKEVKKVEMLIRTLNNRAKVIWADHGHVTDLVTECYTEDVNYDVVSNLVQSTIKKIDGNGKQESDDKTCILPHILNTHFFNNGGMTVPSWEEELLDSSDNKSESNTKDLTLPKEFDKFGIDSVIFRSRKPFHPIKLRDLIKGKIGTINMNKGPTNSKNKKKKNNASNETTFTSENILSSVIRSKGQVWIANCQAYAANWHSVGSHFELSRSSPFQSSLDDMWLHMRVQPHDSSINDPNAKVKFVIDPVFGCRSTELVLIGASNWSEEDKKLILKTLQSALVSDHDFVRAKKEKQSFQMYLEEELEDDNKLKSEECRHILDTLTKESAMKKIMEYQPTFGKLRDVWFGTELGKNCSRLMEILRFLPDEGEGM